MPRQKRMDPALLEAALDGLQHRLAETERRIAEVKSMMRPGRRATGSADEAPRPRTRRKMSAEAKQRIAEAQKRRWAEFRAKAARKNRKPRKAAGKPAGAEGGE